MLLVPKGIDKSALLGLAGFYLSNRSYSTKRILFTITSFFYTNVECTPSEGRYDLTYCVFTWTNSNINTVCITFEFIIRRTITCYSKDKVIWLGALTSTSRYLFTN